MTDKAPDMPPPFNPYLALIVGTLAVSTGAIFARLADAPALVIAAYRVGLASLILAPVAWWKARDEIVKLSGRNLKLAVLSGFFLALHFATWISSLDYTSVANSVVLVNTNPLWVGLLTPLIAKERIRRAAVYSIVISVIGGAIIGYGDFATGGQAIFGDALALAGWQYVRCDLPAIGAQSAPQAVASALYFHLLRQCGAHPVGDRAGFKIARIRVQPRHLGGLRGHGPDCPNSRSQHLQLGPQMAQRRSHCGEPAGRAHRQHDSGLYYFRRGADGL